jgi:hypothetical protein
MKMAVGRLVQSRITEWLPLLGAHTVVNNQITEPCPGFVLYNITDALVATDVSAWFARWLLSRHTTYTATTITLKLKAKARPVASRVLGVAIGAAATLPLLILAAITHDMWGVANVLSVMASVAVRQRMVSQLRATLDRSVDAFAHDPGDAVKVFLTLPNGRAVTIYGPRMAVVGCLLTDPQPPDTTAGLALRSVGWAALGVHVVALGMADLANQILCVAVLVCSTLLVVRHVGDDVHAVGEKLRLKVRRGDPAWTRWAAYARLALTDAEEASMVHWNLFPQRTNRVWWERYREKQSQYVRQASGRRARLPSTVARQAWGRERVRGGALAAAAPAGSRGTASRSAAGPPPPRPAAVGPRSSAPVASQASPQ